jgi:NitT/TauT family transport system substrate-binding protein
MNHRYVTSALFAAALFAVPSLASADSKLVVAMPTTPPNIVHMPIYIAHDLGIYKKLGLTVDTVQLEGGVKTYRAMVAGNADIASASGPFSIVGLARGAPTKIILAYAPKIEASMVVNKDIKTMADLKGKRIGIQQPGGFADILARGVLRAAKIDPKDVHFVSIASEDVPALVANQIDTAILHVEQEIVAQSEVPSLHAIARLWEIQPKNLYNVMAVTDKIVKEKQAALLAFVTGTIEATRLMYTDKARVLPVLIKYTELPKGVVEKAYDFMVENCIWDANHGLDQHRVNFTANLMTKVGNIPQGHPPRYENIVELSFAHEALKELGNWKGPMCMAHAS